MKKIAIIAFTIGILFGFTHFVSADDTPPNTHSLTRCVKISNLNEFPDITLVGYINNIMGDDSSYIVTSDKCLKKGYKFNGLKIYALEKAHLGTIGLDNIDFSQNSNVLVSDSKIDPYGGSVADDNPLIKEDIEYSIVGFSGDKLILYKSKQISKYNNNTPDKVETFEKPVVSELRFTIKKLSPGLSIVQQEKQLVKKVDEALARRLKGRILLQVEDKGQGWYVNPVDENKYYLGRPVDVFDIMKKLGLGISEKDYDSFHVFAPAKLSGRILLRVESKGEAYYVNPIDLKLHYLGRPADAFNIMRGKGLGITNDNLRKIEVGETTD